MNIFQTIILSILEGITEFLPVSSTGHLILASSIMKINQTEFVKSFEIFIQLGAILAVVVVYAKTLLLNKKTISRVVTAFVPTAVIGYILYKAIKHYLLGNPWVVVISLFIGGIALIILERFHKDNEQSIDAIENLTFKQSLLIGLAQSVSVVPGVSRAAATIMGGQLVGLTRKTAVEFSFVLAIPTMAAATGLDLVKSKAFSFTPDQWILMLVGCIGAFLTAIVVIKLFLRYIQTNTFIPFGIYRIIVALLSAIFILR